MIEIPILYQDEAIVVVDKPVELPTHKNKHLAYDAPYLTKLVGDQLGQWVYNVHRLDAKTSGIMVLALSSELAGKLTRQFESRTVSKTYLAIVKGLPGAGTFDQPVLDRKKGRRVNAQTDYRSLQTVTTDLSSKGVDNLALTLLELTPYTGRWHQIRQHCSQQRYDIIGDTQHGDWTLNRLITEKTGVHRLCLHASKLRFQHPDSGDFMEWEAPAPVEFETIMEYWSRS
jgi:tRNA pseudouridine65 synthase